MGGLQRLLLLICGVALLSFAGMLIAAAGLPDRAVYSSVFLPGETRPVAPELNAIAPPFTLRTVQGARVELLALRGQTVVINFWATWCVPCAIEMPELQMVYEALSGQFHLLAINLGESADAVRQWADRHGLTFPLLLDADLSVSSAYRLRAQPSTYIIAPDGSIVAAFFGPVSADVLRSALHPHLSN